MATAMEAKYRLIIVRHGESEYTQQNLFCGFAHDADLTDNGCMEAISAGRMLKKHGLKFDIAYTSVLKRAIKTMYLIQEVMDCHWVPVVRSWRLNERHYGALQGFNKSETAAKYGEEQVKLWRRSYDVRPPPIEPSDERWPGHQRQYAAMDVGLIPASESLKDTIERALPCWHDQIVPSIRSGLNVMIVAHGNSLRGIVKYLDNLSEAEILGLEIPTAIPLIYELNADLRPVHHYYLATKEEVEAAQARLAAQGKAAKKT